MQKLPLNKPTLILLYGYPGAGKTYLARQLCEDLSAAHVHGDRIRSELFENPRFDKQEGEIISHLMEYMAEEFLRAGMSVIFDMNASRVTLRRELRELARKAGASTTVIWLQIDLESAFTRSMKRDRRKADDKFAGPIDRSTFDQQTSRMQNPTPTEDFMVISGKHSYQTQRNAVIKRLYEHGLINPDAVTSKMVKPGLVNLIPNPLAGRVDNSRRNIVIR